MSTKAPYWILGFMVAAALSAVFLYGEAKIARNAARMAAEIKEKSDDCLRQMHGVEQRWILDHSTSTNEILSHTDYNLAQAVYKPFVHDRIVSRPHSHTFTKVPETNLVYCLCYGTSHSPLPLDFMGAFTNPTPRVITGTNGLLFKTDGSIVERATGRPVVVLALRGLVVNGDRADASIRYIDSSRSIAQMSRFIKRDDHWRNDGGFSTSAPSRWGPTCSR
jgi:hypothetical protein